MFDKFYIFLLKVFFGERGGEGCKDGKNINIIAAHTVIAITPHTDFPKVFLFHKVNDLVKNELQKALCLVIQ